MDITDIFEGVELSEDVKGKVKDAFDVSVVEAADERVNSLKEEYDAKIAEIEGEKESAIQAKVDEEKEYLTEKIDGFLNYVVSEWIEDNKIAAEDGIKVNIAEEFTNGLVKIMSESNVVMDSENSTVNKRTNDELSETKEKLNTVLEDNINLKAELNDICKAKVIDEVSEGFTDTQKEKFSKLVENVSYVDKESFKEKIVSISETFVDKNKNDDAGDKLNEDLDDDSVGNVSDIAKRAISAL